MTPDKQKSAAVIAQSAGGNALQEVLQGTRAELSVLKSIQEGLASGLDIDAIFEIAGERIAEIFPGEGIALYTYNPETHWGEAKYILEDGVRHYPPPFESGPIGKKAAETRQPLVISTRAEFDAIGATTILGTAPSLSGVYTPLIVNNRPVGALNIESTTKEHAFDDADVRLVSTIARSLSVALENARLHIETEARSAELAIINKVQTALASKLDMQTIFDVVGDQIHDIFPDAQVVDILTYDASTGYFNPRYVIERGERFEVEPWSARGFRKHVVETGHSMVINEDMEAMAQKYDNDWVVLGEFAKAMVVVPLKVGDQVTGVMSLQHLDRENAFSDADVRMLETLTASMSVALENARLFNETEERNAELAIINTVQRALSAELDIQGIYEAVGEKLREIFDSQIIAVYSSDLKERRITTAYAYEKGQKFSPVTIPFSSLHNHLLELDDTYVFNGDFPDFAAQFDDYKVSAGEMPKSLLGVPVGRKKDGATIVTLTLQDVDGDKFFSESDVRLLETLANSMSVALENARLFDETQRLLLETEQRAAELHIMNSVQEALASKLEMQAIYDLVGEKIREIFNADTTFIAFHDPDSDMVVAPYYTDKGVRNETTSRPYGQGLFEIIIETGKSLHLNTTEEMNALGVFNMVSPGSDKDLNQSFLGVPISRGGTVIGATSVQSYDAYAFYPNDLSLLQTLTNSMSVALENARLFDETQMLLQETEKRAVELATINAVGEALVAESELEALIDLIGEKLRGAFHADIVYVALLQQDSETINFPYTHGQELDPLRLGEGLTSKIILSGEPLLINSELDRRRAEMGVTRIGVKALSYLGVPIQFGGQTFGVISVQSTSEEGRFGDSDLRLLSTIAANVGAALRNAQLFDQIKRQKQYYEAVIENSPAAIVLLDLETNVTGWNPAAERLFGYSESEALGNKVDDLVAFSEELYAEALRYSQKALEEKQVHLLTRRTRKDGSLVDVEVSGLPVSVDGEYVGFIAIYHDVTELQRARYEAEEANQAKSRFLANMSHELRTPLNAIIGFSRIVRRKGAEVLPEKQVENLDKVLVSADHLLGLIDTVLDISKIEAGQMDVQPTTFELSTLVNLVVDTSQPLLREGVRLETDVQDDLPQIFSDEDKLKQILLNLLSNAAKFTHEGAITLASRHDGAWLYVDVNDTGIGVSEDALERIFEDFQQADTSTTREYGGTGLGLPISRSLARLLGGDLTACSIEGEGSTFTLTLPLRYRDNGESEGATAREAE